MSLRASGPPRALLWPGEGPGAPRRPGPRGQSRPGPCPWEGRERPVPPLPTINPLTGDRVSARCHGSLGLSPARGRLRGDFLFTLYPHTVRQAAAVLPDRHTQTRGLYSILVYENTFPTPVRNKVLPAPAVQPRELQALRSGAGWRQGCHRPGVLRAGSAPSSTKDGHTSHVSCSRGAGTAGRHPWDPTGPAASLLQGAQGLCRAGSAGTWVR